MTTVPKVAVTLNETSIRDDQEWIKVDCLETAGLAWDDIEIREIPRPMP